ncbi:MAG: hypothetical protein HC778_00110 [Chamaesiphon sp. CSU_1_12]|nr:hypothetical protein [Chamaesiphon sp. CSU_1_12]
MIELKFFDPHTGEFLLDKHGDFLTESLAHTALEFNFPNGQFSVALLDDRTTVEELQNNHPLGHKLVVSNGSRFVYADPETSAQIDRIFPEVSDEGIRGIKDRGAYGSLLLGSCSGKYEQLRLKLIPEGGDEWELAQARQAWERFQFTGRLQVDVDSAIYATRGIGSDLTPQLLLPHEAYPKFTPEQLYRVTPEFLAEKFEIPTRHIELAPHVFERKLKILIIDDETGANSTTFDVEGKSYGFDNLNKDTARALTGDCHGKMSLELARAKFNVDDRVAIQFRGELKDFGSQLEQEDPSYLGFAADKICKGSLVAHNFDKLDFQGERPDLILAKSSFKGAEKPDPGLYEQSIWLAEKDRGRIGKTLASGLLALYPGMLADIAPIIEVEVANLAAIQNDPVAIAQNFCEDFERREKRLEDTIEEGGEVPNALPHEKYDVIKASLDSGNVAILRSGLVADDLQEFVRTKFRDLALAKHDDIKFDRGFAVPSKELQNGEICVPWLPNGAEIITFRAPLINTNGVHILTNKHVGDFDYSQAATRPEYILCNDDTAASLNRTQQTVMQDFALDFDGDCLGIIEASKFPNLARDIKAAQLERFPDNVKEKKLEFDGCSQEEAALRMINARSVGIIANANMRLQSQLSTISMMLDPQGVATDEDRLRLGGQMRQQLYKFATSAAKKDEPLLVRPANLVGEGKEWFDRLESATTARTQAILKSPRLDLIGGDVDSQHPQSVALAKSLSKSLYGYRQNSDRVWFDTPENLDLDSLKGFAKLEVAARKMTERIDEILGVNMPLSQSPEDAAKVIELYRDLQAQGSQFILQAERQMFRDFVVVGSYQTQVAADMPKSARAAEPEVVARLNKFLPSRIALMQEKESDRVYKDWGFTIDGNTPQEIVANRVNDYFSETQLKVEKPEGYRSLFPVNYTPEIYAQTLLAKQEFDADWNLGARLKSKAREEKGGCVLKITDDLGRDLEITNLNQFTHELAYQPELLAGLSFTIVENNTRDNRYPGIDTYHRYAIVAQGLPTQDDPTKLSKAVLGTLCDFTAKELGITPEDVFKPFKFIDVSLAAPQPDLSSQYFQAARETATRFHNSLLEANVDVVPYAAAMWHELTNKEGVALNSFRYDSRANSISNAMCYFFPAELSEQIQTHPLNLHQISLLPGVTPADLPAPGEAFNYKLTNEPVIVNNIEIGKQRTVNLVGDDGILQPIAKPWDNAIPFDASGRVCIGEITQSGMHSMFIDLPGINAPLEFGKVNANYLADRQWTDGLADIGFKPVIKDEYQLFYRGQKLGTLEQRAVMLLQGTDSLKDGTDLNVRLSATSYQGNTNIRVLFPAREDCPGFSCDLEGKKSISPESLGLKSDVPSEVTLNITVIPRATVGVFLRMRGKHIKIGELTTSAGSKATIVELARAGILKWTGLSVESDAAGQKFVSGNENRRFTPEILQPDFVTATLRSSGKNLAIESEPIVAPQRLPVMQQSYGTDFIDRVYASVSPQLSFDTTFGRLPLAAKLAVERTTSDELMALFDTPLPAKTTATELAALFDAPAPTVSTKTTAAELAALFDPPAKVQTSNSRGGR